MSESDLRYTFSCPSCAESLSIPLAKIPPVQARFGCPKCGKQMDFPSREEARVYAMLQSGGGAAAEPASTGAPAAAKASAAVADAPAAEKLYRVEKKGFENDVYDRRSMRSLIRSGGLLENDSVAIDSDPARRAGEIPELKSLFDLRKSSRVQPPTVCRKHTDRVAYYVCAGTDRPLCEECAAEKKFGGASVRVCEHCGGTVNEIPVALEP